MNDNAPSKEGLDALDAPATVWDPRLSEKLDAAQKRINELEERIDALERPGRRGSHETGDAQVDDARVYQNVRNAVIALLAVVSLLVGMGIFDGKARRLSRLSGSLALTGTYLLFFGTLDSLAMEKTAVLTYRAWFIVLGPLWSARYALVGKYLEAAFYLVFCWFGLAVYFAWFLKAVRRQMRKRFQGELAENAQRYAKCLLEIGSVQAALLVQGLARGIGPKSEGRNEAIFAFSVSLLVAWIFETAVFDAGAADNPRRAARLQLTFLESAAMVASILYVLTGLAGYIVAEQDDADATVANRVQIASFSCVLVAAGFVGLIVQETAKKQAASPHVPAQTSAQLFVQCHPAGGEEGG